MTKRKKIIIAVTSIVVIIMLALVYYRINQNIQSANKRSVSLQPVKLISPEKGEISNKLLFSGDMLSFQQANIYSRVTGNIEKIYVDAGDYVSTGQLLAVIDKSQYLQTLKQAEATLNQYKATLENNEVNFQRISTLYTKGLSSQGDFDNANTQVKVTQSQIEAADAMVKNAELQVSYCNITAPFSGFITKKLLDRGALVSSGTTNSIFILADISKLKVMVNIPEKNLASINNVHSVDISVDAYKDEMFKGEFRKISQAFDLSSRTMPAEIWIDNPGRVLKPGMFAKIEISLEKHSDVMIVPAECVLSDDNGSYVFVVNDGQTAQKKYVQKGIESDNRIEILSGLNYDDNLVFVGQALINENSKVKISQ